MNDFDANTFSFRRPLRHTGGGDASPTGGLPPRGAPSVRVVSVGSITLERRLRRVPEVELLRGGSLLEAIGELSEPSPASDGAPLPTVVAVSSAALPTEDDANDFAAAVRLAHPGARLVAISDRLDGSPEHGATPLGFDACHTADASLETLLNGVSTPPVRASHAHPSPPPRTARGHTHSSDATPIVHELGGDGPLVAAALRGRALHDAAVRVLKSRLGTEHVAYRAACTDTTSAAPTAPGPDGVRTIAVERAGRVHGHLQIDHAVAERDARLAAAWMGDWLELGAQLARARNEASTDPLTGAWNRRYFDRYLARAIEHARTQRHALTLLVFDIDDFKSYNDRHGHAAGDDILTETVRLMRSMIRPSDRVCRIGGDEFAVVFYEPDGPRDPSSKPPSSVHAIAQRFQSGVRSSCFPKLGLDAPGGLTISGGLATFPWDGHDSASLVARADQLALEAKKQGKNCITYGPEAASLSDASAPGKSGAPAITERNAPRT